MPVKHDLVFDIGMHTGVDTRYYLDLGYRVVAVEANPSLASEATERFSAPIADGRLIIENIGISSSPTTMPFYVNHQTSEWSSFVPHLGKRGGAFDVIDVTCITLSDLCQRHGVPHFMKIDIEGFDHIVARDVVKLPNPPNYLSVEDGGIVSLISLYEAGARKFKFTNQPDMHASINKTTGKPFGESSSGPFGEEIPGHWLTDHEAFEYYVQHVRKPGQPPERGWWDIHASFYGN